MKQRSITSFTGTASDQPDTLQLHEHEASNGEEPFPDKITMEMLYSRLDTLQADVTTIKTQLLVLSDVEDRVTKLEERQNDFEKSCEYATTKADDNETRIASLEQKVCQLTENLKNTQEESTRAQRRLRECSLRFYGVKEERNEKPMEVARQLLMDKFKVSDHGIEKAFRAPVRGSITNNRSRPIIVKFTLLAKSQQILRKAKQALVGTEIYIKQDLLPADYKKKRLHHKIMAQAYKDGKKPIFRNGMLYIDGVKYSGPPPTLDVV